MTRIARLELVVRTLADRILGEEVTFDAIAEQEAAEHGVPYVAPAAEPVDMTPVLDALSGRIAALEQRPVEQVQVPVQANIEPVPCQCETFDPAPFVEEIRKLQSALSAKDAQLVKQERFLQVLAQSVDDANEKLEAMSNLTEAADELKSRVDRHETRLDAIVQIDITSWANERRAEP